MRHVLNMWLCVGSSVYRFVCVGAFILFCWNNSAYICISNICVHMYL